VAALGWLLHYVTIAETAAKSMKPPFQNGGKLPNLAISANPVQDNF
jgi:hypothetical protein